MLYEWVTAVFRVKLPIYDSPLQPPNLFGVVRSPALAPFRRLGQRILYKWYWARGKKFFIPLVSWCVTAFSQAGVIF